MTTKNALRLKINIQPPFGGLGFPPLFPGRRFICSETPEETAGMLVVALVRLQPEHNEN